MLTDFLPSPPKAPIASTVADVPQPSRILVVDDDPTIRDVLCRYLTHAGFEVLTADDGAQALVAVAEQSPDLVVLDVMLPALDGIEVCRQLRATTPVPVVMLTALGEEDDRVIGLEVGADDYVAKPFSPRELVARIQAVLRRSATALTGVPTGPALTDGGLHLDSAAHEVTLHGEVLALTTREYDLLAHLMAHPDTVFTREELLREVWGWDFGDQSTVTVHVRRLRSKLGEEAEGGRIVTVYGLGYRWRSELVP